MRLRDALAARAKEALNAAQDRVIEFDRAGGVGAFADRLGERLRQTEARLLASAQALTPEHQLQLQLWYARLELPAGAGADDVRRAFRALMRRYHPDKFSGSADDERIATRLSQELTVAYEGLLSHLGER